MERKLIIEQSSRIDLNKAFETGCISKYKWIKPETIQVGKLKDGRDVIAAENTKGEQIRFFSDFSVLNTNTKVQAKWECTIKDPNVLGKIAVKSLTPTDVINKY